MVNGQISNLNRIKNYSSKTRQNSIILFAISKTIFVIIVQKDYVRLQSNEMILHNFNLHLRDNIQLKYDDDQQIKSLKNQLNHLQKKMVHAVEYLNEIVSVSLVSIIILSRLFKSHFVYLISTINCLLYSNLILIF